jgi:hypothetical protein
MKHQRFLRGLGMLTLLAIPLGGFAIPSPAAQPAQPAEPKLPAILTAKPLQAGPGDDDLRKLLIARYNAAVAEAAGRIQEFQTGHCNLEAMAGVARRLVDSGLELRDKAADQVTLREQFLELAKEIEKIVQVRFEAGRISPADLELAHYERLDAEIQVLKARRKAAGR